MSALVRTCLYRHFDAENRLLYVGISKSALTRLGQHLDSSHWSQSIARVTVEWFDTRADALNAEAKAIRDENPAHNVQRPKPFDPAIAARSSDWLLDSLVGCYFYTWEDRETRKKVQYQGQFVGDLNGGYFLVEFFSWLSGFPTNCAVVNIADVCSERWCVFRDQEDREAWHVRNSHKVGGRE